MTDYLSSHQGHVLDLLLHHLTLCAVALGVSFAIALPLGILISRYAALYTPVLSAFGAIYTIPSLALLALLVPTFGLNATTALIALVLYAQFILLRNIVTGLRGVDAALLEAARGMGMSPLQVLWRVELPLALPVIVAGIRIATVTVIAVTTIATYIGVSTLGDLLSEGGNRYPTGIGEIEAGGLALGVLAIGADLLLRAIEWAATRSASGAGGPAVNPRRAADVAPPQVVGAQRS